MAEQAKEELTNKKKMRGGHRGYIKTVLSNAKELVENAETWGQSQIEAEKSKKKLKVHKKTLEDRMKILLDLDEKIVNILCADEEATEEVIGAEITAAGDFEAEIHAVLQEIEECVGEKQPPTPPSSEYSSTGCVQTSSTKTHRARLPKLEIPKFKGKLEKWQEFWDSFLSAIHENGELSAVDKFTYLRGLLEGNAKSAIAGFALTNANYFEAIELLRRRYGKKSAIQRAHVNELMNIAPVFNEKDTNRLRKLFDHVETHYRGLNAMGVDELSYSSIVVPAVLEKLPGPLKLTMTRGRDYLEWSLGELLEALLVEVELRESHDYKPMPERRDFGRDPKTASALYTGYKDERCAFCLQEHKPELCPKVKDVRERKAVLRKFARCFNCLAKGHRANECRHAISCRYCRGNHNSALCFNPKGGKEGSSNNYPTEKKDVNLALGSGEQEVMSPGNYHIGVGGKVALQTARASVGGRRVRVLFDSGSHKSFVTAKVAEVAGLDVVRKEWLSICTFGGGKGKSRLTDVVEIEVKALDRSANVKIEAYVVPEITRVHNDHIEEVKTIYAHLRDLWLSDACKTSEELEIELLVGADYLWQFQTGRTIRGKPGEPVAIETVLGWVLSGPMKCMSVCGEEEVTIQANLIVQETKSLDQELRKLWDLETLGIREENEVQEEFLDSISFNGKRYSVKLPWKIGHRSLPTNYANSIGRLKSTMRRLRKEPDVLKEYESVIKEQLEAGIIETVSNLEESSEARVHYLPHQAVVRRNAETTKVRVVYDASSKDSKGSASLNDCLHVGPSLNPLLFDILLRFRMYRVALIADIEKAFLNVEVDPNDRDCLRFLWPEDPRDDKSCVRVYRFCRVVFGLNASPFLLNSTLRHHLMKYKAKDPSFVQILVNSFYVDDLVAGDSSADSAYNLYQKAKERLAEGGFRLRKWLTNDESLAGKLEVGETKTQGDPGGDTYAKETLGGASDRAGSHKVLGLPWDNGRDVLQFEFKQVYEKAESLRATKRNVLRVVAGLFDPLGLVSPIMVSAKMLFQALCVANLEWDDELAGAEKQQWESWVEGLRQVERITVARCVLDAPKVEISKARLHGFADASKKAYCAMVYLVYDKGGERQVRLLCSKTRVAPLKELTIPRLELMAARILVPLVNKVKEGLSSLIELQETVYWSDSITVLYWLENRGEWKQFVKHRVGEILELSSNGEWRHCPGADNPADIGSRGARATELKSNRLWWDGPQWLTGHEKDWPVMITKKTPESAEEERKTVNLHVSEGEPTVDVSAVIDIERYSNVIRLYKVTAWVKRFIHNARARMVGVEKLTRALTRDELMRAEVQWLKSTQAQLRQQGNFQQLSRKLGLVSDEGLLRCKGRLCNSELEQDAVRPIILPKKHRLTELIVLDCHGKVHHSGVRATLTQLRSKFWVPKGRQVVKRLTSKCVTCKEVEGKACSAPPVADLPDYRVRRAEPFSKVGVDFAGPLFYKTSSGMEKAYIALFSCCVTRALHLDLVRDLTTPAFRRCLRRFTARRGAPSLIVSDNGKTFKATAKAVKSLYDHPEIKAYLETARVDWKFNLERSPWWGGFFERMVGTVKRCLKKTLGNARLTFDELLTVLIEIEGTLNDRPLTYVYDEIGEEVLTPSHLIFGRRVISMPDEIVEQADYGKIDYNARFKYLTNRLEHFWNRWKKEYLCDLREYHDSRGGSKGSTVEVGDVVLVADEDKKRNQWRKGVVESLVRGKDNVVRGARVRTVTSGKLLQLTRPLQKLHPLEVKGTCEEFAVTRPEVQRGGGNNIERARPKRAAALQARDNIAIRAVLDS